MSDEYIEDEFEQVENQLNDLFEEAEENSDLQEKVDIYGKIIDLSKSNDIVDVYQISALNELFSIYSDLENRIKQLEVLDCLLALDSDKKVTYLKRKVKIFKKYEDYENAIRFQLEIIDLSTKPTEILELADLYEYSNNFEKRDEYLKNTVTLYYELINISKDNETKVTAYRLAIIGLLLKLKLLDRVEEEYQKIIEKTSINKEKYILLLCEFYEEKTQEYLKAINQYKELIKINPSKHFDYLEKIAELFKKIPNFVESINTYEELIKKNSYKEEEYLNQIVKIFIENLTNYNKALEKYSVLESKYDKVLYREKIADFHIRYTKDYYHAIEVLKELLDLNYSEKVKYLERIASIYEEDIKEFDESIVFYEQLIASRPENKVIYQKSIIRLLWNKKKDSYKTIEKIEDFFGKIPTDNEIKNIYEEVRNLEESKDLETKGKIGEHFEETEKEFKKTLLIYMLLILNIVFLIIVFNKDIFFEKKEDVEKRLEKIEKQKKNEAQKKLDEVSKPYVLEVNNIIKASQ